MMIVTRRTFLRTGLAAGAAVAGAGVYGFAYERSRVTITRTTIAARALRPEIDGLRVGILTDLHHSALVSHRHISDAARALMSEHPDLIALLGDFVTWGDQRYAEGCAEALGQLSAPYGVFAILGNHDDERSVPRALGQRGFEVLMDARTHVRIGGRDIGIAGLRYWTRQIEDIARVATPHARGETVLLLAHDPRRVYEAASLSVPVVVSGHTHGGQIVLPLFGAVAARKYPVAEGVARVGGSSLFVSRGVGTVFVPIRLNCPPEVAVVTLKSSPA